MSKQGAQTETATLVEQAVLLLHHDIVSGKLSPGEKLGIASLVDAYKIGATPIREALVPAGVAGAGSWPPGGGGSSCASSAGRICSTSPTPAS